MHGLSVTHKPKEHCILLLNPSIRLLLSNMLTRCGYAFHWIGNLQYMIIQTAKAKLKINN